ncbi:MAG: hypothetical protein JWM50_1747 [Microbacteriaceae bacterium]|nr:hypothetical protein [Microbacteriaceae bacterium]
MALFAVLIYADDSLHSPDATPEDLAEPDAHADQLRAGGWMRAAYAFTPRGMARSIRSTGVSVGPYIESEQVVAGFYVIDAPDLDAALIIAGTNNVITDGGGVEVRPVHSGGPIE